MLSVYTEELSTENPALQAPKAEAGDASPILVTLGLWQAC